MAHKKTILDKFYLSSGSSESSDCRSPRFDGRNWLIPETSSSHPEKSSEEDQEGQANPPPGINSSINQQNPQQSTSGVNVNIPNKTQWKEDDGNDSSSKWKNFPTDTSPGSGVESKKNSGSSGMTVPFLGTSVHPITASSSSEYNNLNPDTPQF